MKETISFHAIIISQSFSRTFYEHIYYSCFWSCTFSELILYEVYFANLHDGRLKKWRLFCILILTHIYNQG